MPTDERSGLEDPLWGAVASFGIEEVFAEPEWVAALGGRRDDGSGDMGDTEKRMDALRTRLGDCEACRLSEGRGHLVFGEGNPSAGIVLVGEAPGAREDETGRPFVGRAGQLLDRILAAIDLDRESVYITNIVKCRPPGNRTPSGDEVAACRWVLEEQVGIMEPGVIVTLGAPASRTLTGSSEGIGSLRGAVQTYVGADIPVVPTYHPAALLRNPSLKRPVWEDMKRLREMLDALGLPRRRGGGRS